jgi:hypothetical protein
MKLGIMIETPASVEIIEELCKEGVKFISFGTNDLTQYTLAIDRGNEEVQYLYDEMHPSVLSQLGHVIEVCKRYGVETSICGQAGSKKEMVEFLVKKGIDSISVNADKAREISEYIKELEERGLKDSELGGETEEHKEKEEKYLKKEDVVESKMVEDKPLEKDGAEEKKKEEAKKEGWQEDVNFGFDIFSGQNPEEKLSEELGEEKERVEIIEEPVKKKVEIIEETEQKEPEENIDKEKIEVVEQGETKEGEGNVDKEEKMEVEEYEEQEEGSLDIF